MQTRRIASLFRNGRNQAVRIPVEYELPGTEVFIRRAGNLVILEPKEQSAGTWLEALQAMEPLGPDDVFPDVNDDDLPPQRDVDL
jgi:antitoxin VapB